MMPIWLSSRRSGITSLTLQATSGLHEELWKVPAGGPPGQIATPVHRLALLGFPRSAQPDHRPWTTHGGAHTSHSPGHKIGKKLLTRATPREYDF
jgi:hypothetical protein